MGEAYSYKCDKCNHEETLSLGVGFKYPMQLEEVKAEILAGKYGTTAEAFLKNNPTAKVIFDYAVYRCPNCGKVENLKHINIEVPGKRKVKIVYQCSRCSGTMTLQKNIPESFRCPECSGTLHIDLKDIVLWD